MDWGAILAEVLSWWPSAVSSILVIVVLSFIRKIDTMEKTNAAQNEELQKHIEFKITEVREQFNVRFKELKHDMERVYLDHSNRISYIEHEYTKNDSFWRELSGWKSEIHNLSNQFADHYLALNKNILQLANKGGSK